MIPLLLAVACSIGHWQEPLQVNHFAVYWKLANVVGAIAGMMALVFKSSLSLFPE
ncbi:MAG: hypothetical protein ACPGLY_25425 [Rubripirellula sp.]